MKRIGLVDTTFARTDMGGVALGELKRLAATRDEQLDLRRRTVPGFKDLAVECLLLFERESCDICLAFGWVGGMPIDTQCAHEASMSIGSAQLLSRKHILEVFVHERESSDISTLAAIAADRCIGHARNAFEMLFTPESLTHSAGRGLRQGGASVEPISLPFVYPRP